ncbi:hypothetical protein, partial [Pseudomonas sp. DCB_Q]|uniref:hypothetical protein n=1 Tax=Pseudomonas sp. DCB_Q TaxID=2993589 RepID=UPI00226E099F
MPTEKIIVIQSLEQSNQQYDAPSAEQSAQLLLPAPQRFRQDRVGGGFTPAVLSHHRAYGSVHGGSGYAAKPVNRIQYRDQPE